MISTDRITVVEGKYDKIKLSGIIDGVIVCTDGFGIFNSEKIGLLRRYAQSRGIMIITDGDSAGFRIRNYLRSALGKDADIVNIYIPDVYGKERRKVHPSKEGKLGVEGLDDALLESLIRKGLKGENPARRREIDKALLFEAGLSGCGDSSARRAELLKRLDLPERLSPNALVDVLNVLFTKEEFIAFMERDPF